MYGEDFKLGHHDELQLINPRTRKRVLDHQEHLIPHRHPSKNKILSKSQIIFMDLSLATTFSDQEPDQDQETTEIATTTTCSNNSNNLNLDLVPIEKEHMFDKVVTPSDVGKLNRLVIPKQHAEKYFPLADSNQNGTLLNFQDRNGKMWRFRYSYWNSSQSYVMTKGWSRFVKEKTLDAGDIVSFHRGVGGEFERSKLFIDWRHRPDINLLQNNPTSSSQVHVLHRLATGNFTYNYINSFNNFPTALHSGRLNSVYPPEYSVPVSRSLNFGVHNSYHRQHHQCNYRQEREINLGYGYGSILGRCCYARSPLDQNNPVGSEPLVIDSVPVVPGRINPGVVAPSPVIGKRLRLFGVNMEYTGTDGDVPIREMGASSSSSSSSSSTLQLSLSSDDQDQFAKKGKSTLSFGLDP